jgi:hypothetical protein
VEWAGSARATVPPRAAFETFGPTPGSFLMRFTGSVLRRFLRRTSARAGGSGGGNILDQYVMSAPDPQNALDIFRDEWSSKLPPPWDHLSAGTAALFEDPRIRWFAQQAGGVAGKSVLELGPLEAGHTTMLERMGAASVLAVEANTRAYLKCLVIKELMGLARSRFVCGNFVEYLRSSEDQYDVCLASGVLYHMANPIELLELLSRASGQVWLWTHHYDAEIIGRSPREAVRFTRHETLRHAGFECVVHCREYAELLGQKRFCGGGQSYSYWLHRDDIIGCLKHFGFSRIEQSFDDPDHPHGPSVALVALRS